MPRPLNGFLIGLFLVAIVTSQSTVQAQTRTIATFAGVSGAGSSIDGIGAAARFSGSDALAVDDQGNAYVAEDRTIRKVTPLGRVTTLAGLAEERRAVDESGTDGVGSTARFIRPTGVAIGRDGSLYVADVLAIRKVTPSGAVTTLPGPNKEYYRPGAIAAGPDGNLYVIDGGDTSILKITPSGSVTTIMRVFWSPQSITVDRSGNIYVTDGDSKGIRKFAPDGTLTIVNFGSTHFEFIGALTCDGSGNLYFAGYAAGKSSVNKITPEGVITQVAGVHVDALAIGRNGILYACEDRGVIMTISPEGTVTTLAGVSDRATHADGPAPEARFFTATGVAFDQSGNLYVADYSFIRKISHAGYVTTLASGRPDADSQGDPAAFSFANDLTVDSAGNIYVADSRAIRKITPDGTVSTLAGGTQGSADGIGSAAGFRYAAGITSDGEGNLYVADSDNQTIRKVTPAGQVTTIAGGAGERGSADGQGSAARFSRPSGVAVDAIGNIYVADTDNSTIRKITPDGNVSTIAGLAGISGTADGVRSAARFYAPFHMAIDASGDLYIADLYSIRRMDAAGAVTTVAGNYRSGYADGTGTEAHFAGTEGVAIDSIGNLYIGDLTRIRIGRVALSDAATIDLSTGRVADTRRFDTSSHTADRWQWNVTRRPVDSMAELSSATVRNPTFTPDVPGLFQFKLVASSGEATRISTLEFVSLPVPVRQRAVGH